MKTSHEMAVSVLRKRDKILRMRRILTTSAAAFAGTAAVAAALLITLNLMRPRGVELIEPGPTSLPTIPDNTTASESSVPDDANSQYLYNDVEIRADSGTNSLDSYSALAEYLEMYKGSMNFYMFTITKQYTPNEAFELTGSELFLHRSTLFSAHIEYDFLNKKPADMDILLTQAGSAESQIENSPLYGVGEKYVAFLPGFNASLRNTACPELLFAAANSSECFHINAQQIRFETAQGEQLGEEIPEDEQFVYTTTSNNPVRYVRKYNIDRLSDFLRTDWTSRGLYSGEIPSGYTAFENSDIPDIPPSERGFEADGAEKILLDQKQAGELSVLLVGDYVSSDSEEHAGMINCFKFGVAIYDGNTVGRLYGAPFDLGQGGYWLYTDRLSDYTNVFRFGDNYIIVQRYYDSDGTCRAAFHAIKGGEFFPTLMGDYSAVTGVQTGVTTWLSDNLSVDEETCTITDANSGISYTFDFDAMSATFTTPHYTVRY